MHDIQKIVQASSADIENLEQLVETCYRGDLSKQGWTTEADMFEGPRVTQKMLKEDMVNPSITIFKCVEVEEGNKMIGCVRTERHGDKLRMGMICVHPSIQNGGLGRKLLEKVQEFAKETGCSAVQIWVLLQRTELLAWYERRGFKRTGDSVPVPSWDGKETSKQTMPLDVLVLEKEV